LRKPNKVLIKIKAIFGCNKQFYAVMVVDFGRKLKVEGQEGGDRI